MKLKEIFNKVKHSKTFSIIKSLITLGGNSKFAPSSLAFFMMISLIPVTTIIVLILSFLGYEITDLITYMENYFHLSNEVVSILEHYFINVPSSSKTLFGFSIIVLIYISSKGITFFMYAYNKINNINNKFTNIIYQRIFAIFTTLISEVILSFFIVFLGFFNNILYIENITLRRIIFALLITLFLFVLLLFLYTFSNNRKTTFKDVFIGALISSLSITFGMTIYIFYLEYFSNASSYYGSLTNFILLLIIIYYSSYIVLLGIQINYMIKNRKKEPPHGDS